MTLRAEEEEEKEEVKECGERFIHIYTVNEEEEEVVVEKNNFPPFGANKCIQGGFCSVFATAFTARHITMIAATTEVVWWQ